MSKPLTIADQREVVEYLIDENALSSDFGARWLAALDAPTLPAATAIAGEEKPCPFCGSEAIQQVETDGPAKWGTIRCGGCGAQCGEVRTGYDKPETWRADAIEEWNRRAAPVAAAPALSEADVAKMIEDGVMNDENSEGWALVVASRILQALGAEGTL